jgi:isocitrate dehydrogenase
MIKPSRSNQANQSKQLKTIHGPSVGIKGPTPAVVAGNNQSINQSINRSIDQLIN